MSKFILENVYNVRNVLENMNGNFTSRLNDNITKDMLNKSTIILDNKEYSLENTLHYSEDKKQYLLESRLFEKETDSMVNAYLEIFNENLEIADIDVDDVWEYADWKAVS